MANRAKTLAVAGLLILALGAGAVAWIWFPWVFPPPCTIHVASGRVGSAGQRFIAAFHREMAEEYPRVRLVMEEGESFGKALKVSRAASMI
jgi:hypothetical protein